MLKVFKKRLVLEILGILLLSLLIWYAGPYLAFADHRPLATEGAGGAQAPEDPQGSERWQEAR